MTKETTDEISTKASRIMLAAQEGGPLVIYRAKLLEALDDAIRNPKHCPTAQTEDEQRLAAIETVLRPYIDAAESVAASALGQDTTKGKRA